MATIPKRKLTDEEKADAKRLKSAWEAFQKENKGATQEWLAATTKLGTQGLIGQYLNGVIQLNHKALLEICKVIKVNPESISQNLSASLPTMGQSDDSKYHLVYVDDVELRILTLHRQSTESGKELILDAAVIADKA